jgi:predicted glutamine amidotransferase
MCGLIGFSAYKGQKFDVNKVKILFMYNQERGKDASGFWTPQTGVVKSVDAASKFLTKDFSKIVPDCSLIGHVRAGSAYKTFVSAAHPFEGNNCVLAHNGTLDNTEALTTEYNTTNPGTDTELLHKIMDSNFGAKIFSQIDGTASLLVADKNIKLKKGQENSFLLAFRLNNQRPLYFGMSNEGMYISSLKEGLEAIECTEITEFSTNILYTIFEGGIINDVTIPSRALKNKVINHSNYGTNVYAGSGSAPAYWAKYLNGWIQTDRASLTTDPIKYEIDDWFLLKEIKVADCKLVVENIDGNKLTLGFAQFYYNQKLLPINPLAPNTKVVVMTNIHKTDKPSEFVFFKGDVVDIQQKETTIKGASCISATSLVDGVVYELKKEFVRACMINERHLSNIINNAKHIALLPPKTDPPVIESEILSTSKIEESYLAQFMVENNLLKNLSVDDIIKATDDSKIVSEIFDLCEDNMISFDDLYGVIEEHESDLDLMTLRCFKDEFDTMKEKVCETYIKTVELWKKKKESLLA